jgi:acetate kinase
MPIGSRNVLLVFNAGSATLKFSLHDLNEQPAAELGHGSMDLAERGATLLLNSTLGNQAFQASWPGTGQGLEDTAIHQLLGWVDSIAGLSISAVAHRIVHGGNRQQVAARVTPRWHRWRPCISKAALWLCAISLHTALTCLK